MYISLSLYIYIYTYLPSEPGKAAKNISQSVSEGGVIWQVGVWTSGFSSRLGSLVGCSGLGFD